MEMKSKKGASIANFIYMFIGIIVALAFIQAIAISQGTLTNTLTLTQGQYTAPAAGSCVDLAGQDLLSTPVVTNRTSGAALSTTNYTIAEGISTTTGVQTIRFCTVGASGITGAINVSYTYGDFGYVDDTGGRSMAGLFVLFAALALLGYVLYASGLFEDMKNWF